MEVKLYLQIGFEQDLGTQILSSGAKSWEI